MLLWVMSVVQVLKSNACHMWSSDFQIHYHYVHFYWDPSSIFSLYIILPSSLCHHCRRIAPCANVSCSVYPTVNKSYLVLSFYLMPSYCLSPHQKQDSMVFNHAGLGRHVVMSLLLGFHCQYVTNVFEQYHT